MSDLFRIVDGPLSIQEAVDAVAGPDRGAIATFIGTTRNEHAGRRVLSLEYQAYAGMAETVMRDIGREVGERFGASGVAILHRVGTVRVGEASVVIAVAAAHRREALAGCAHAIERLKASVPIWKKEFFEGGASWIEGPEQPPTAG